MTPTEELRHLLDENAELRGRLIHWELHECPGCKNVADLQEALDENAKLREQLVNAQVENAKLRELVRDWHDFECFGCGSCNYGVQCQQRADAVCVAPMLLKDRMHELGIEADDDGL